MNDIALPAFHVTTTTTCSVKLDYRLAQDLLAYRQFYKQAYNADVTEPELIREMARRFMESDREFQTFKSQRVTRTDRKGRRSLIPSETKIDVSPAAVASSLTKGLTN